MKKKIMAIAVTAAMVAAVLGGCGADNKGAASGEQISTESSDADTRGTESKSKSGDKITLSINWWGNQTRNDLTKKVIDLYMEQNPNVEIKAEFSDWSGYWDKLSAMAAGGSMPDIIQQDYSLISQYQQSGQLADLTPYIEDGTIDTTNIPEGVIESGSIEGKCYAVSLGSNAPLMLYDKALVEQAGVTMPEQPTIDELYEIGEKIYETTGVKTYFDGGIGMMQIIARTNGSHLFDELSKGDSTAVLEHFQNVERFSKSEAAISPDLLAEKNPDDVETKPLVDQTTWNDYPFSNQYISISNASGRELGLCMCPTTVDAKSQPMYLKPGMFFAVSETSEHKEEAAKFIDWFTNSVECNEILLGERGIPVNTEVAEAIKSKVDEKSALVFDYIAKVSEIAEPIDAPDPAGKGEIEAIARTMVENVRYQELTAEEAAKDFTEQSQTILSEAKQ